MANTYYTILKAKNIHTLWDGKSFESLIPSIETEYANHISPSDPTGMFGWRQHNWGCDGRIFLSNVTTDCIQLQTASTTPWFIVSKLSELLKDTELTQIYSDTTNYSNDVFTIIWRNGKMQQAFAQNFNWDTDKYNDKYPIDTTTKFDR